MGKTLQKFMDWLQYKVTPAVQKFTERPWVHGFSAGLVKCLPFILTGCLIFFYNVVQPYFPNILPNLSAVSNYTFSMLSLLVAFMMVYQEMGSLKHRNYQVVGGLTGICAYILAMKGTTVDGVYSVTWNRFGPTGIVVAICIGLYVSIIFHLIAKLNLFKNNNTIPEFVQEWIKNIIPIFLSILLLKIVIIDLDVDLYPIVLKLFAPINAIAQTFPGFILLNLFCCFFYSLGPGAGSQRGGCGSRRHCNVPDYLRSLQRHCPDLSGRHGLHSGAEYLVSVLQKQTSEDAGARVYRTCHLQHQ